MSHCLCSTYRCGDPHHHLFCIQPFWRRCMGHATEGGAIGAFIVFCMAMWRKMRLKFKDALIETAKLTVMIFTIIWGVLIFVRFLGFADLPGAFSDWITSLNASPLLILVYPISLCSLGCVYGRNWDVIINTTRCVSCGDGT